MPFTIYLRELREKLRTGQATEATHYGTLATLLEALADDVTAIVQPQHVRDCGAPDIAIKRGQAAVGYVECKDIGQNLDKWEKDEQLLRYRDSLPNLILTDYLEFRWYVEGERRGEARLGWLDREGKVRSTKEGVNDVGELLRAFLLTEPPIAATAQELARYMAGAAQMIRNMTGQALNKEEEGGELHGQLQAFRDTLIPDLDYAQFADMYAQTIAYGLFSARYNVPAGTKFTREHAAFDLPKTNPFLRDLFNQIAGIDLDQSIVWIVDELAELLNRAEMGEIAADFARRPGREDPVVHFYEDFLREYDPKEKKLRGVYYTPEPVVKYIVRSIDYLLKEKFDKPLGLADEEVYILDPASGTGTFLYFVIDQIHKNVCDQLGQGAWKSYVQERLLRRVFGFELLMAPYTIAHMKLAIQLQDLGYDFRGDERLGIYLTNSLEEAIELAEGQLRLGIERTIAEESEAAGDIKRTKPIMVVLGNPPYSSSSVNTGPWITQLIEDYKTTVREEETQISALSDDYIKFLRFAQWRIQRTGHGIVGMITNNNYFDGIMFRDVRNSLLCSFSSIYLVDLHGNVRRRETTPDGEPDENVFDIQQGVGIAILERPGQKSKGCTVRHTDLWGDRESKYQFLATSCAGSTTFSQLQPRAPDFLFVPLSLTTLEYRSWNSITYVFGTGSYSKDKTRAYGTGFKTQQDEFAICFTCQEISDHIAELLAPEMTETELRQRYKLCSTRQWNFSAARSALKEENWRNQITKCLYRPFDHRWTVFNRHVVTNPRVRIMSQLMEPNLGLCVGRAGQVVSGTWTLIFATDSIDDQNLFRRGGNMVFPLYLYPEEGTTEERRRANLNPRFVEEFGEKLGLTFIPDAGGDLTKTFGPEDVFYYAYAVFHSPTYRQRYAEFLKIDFPRLPLTSDKDLFAKLVEKGKRLADLHLMRAEGEIGERPRFQGEGSNDVETVRYDDTHQRVYINNNKYFEGIEPEVWEFHIGGYQVCQKWLKDRKGRTLSINDITHYQRIVLALRETIHLMAEIDQIIPRWPME